MTTRTSRVCIPLMGLLLLAAGPAVGSTTTSSVGAHGGTVEVTPEPAPEAPELPPEVKAALVEANQRRIEVNRYGQMTLAAWAVANLAVGIVGDATADARDAQAYFHQMNWAWNTVNIVIAGIGIFNSYRADPTKDGYLQSLDRAKGAELTYLINGLLDLAYISSGGWLWDRGLRKGSERLEGYGQSLIMQGGFLLAYDIVMFSLSKWVTGHITELPVKLIPMPHGVGITARF